MEEKVDIGFLIHASKIRY